VPTATRSEPYYSGPTPMGALAVLRVVGTGMTARHRVTLAQQLTALSRRTSPFEAVPADIARHAHWVTAKHVGDVDRRRVDGN
jgi:hypothetical protein